MLNKELAELEQQSWESLNCFVAQYPKVLKICQIRFTVSLWILPNEFENQLK